MAMILPQTGLLGIPFTLVNLVVGKCFNYQCYGLTLEANRPIPGLLSRQATSAIDVSLDLSGIWPTWVRFPEKSKWTLLFPTIADLPAPSYEAWSVEINDKPYLLLSYCINQQLAFKFLIDPSNLHVYSFWTQNTPFQEVLAATLGPVLGIIMRLHSKICLHASVVVFDDRAIALVGDSGRGKSTTAAYLASFTQASILADDLAIIETKDATDLVAPGYPRLRLGAKPLAALTLDSSQLDEVSALKDKYYLPLGIDESGPLFETQPVPLTAIYILQPRSKVNTAIGIAAISAANALLELSKHCYASYVQNEVLSKKDFRELGGLVQRVPVRAMTLPNDLSSLAQSCQSLHQDWLSLCQQEIISKHRYASP